MARKEKEAISIVTEFWARDKRGSSGYILVSKFNGYIPVNNDLLIGGRKSNGSYVVYILERSELDILNGKYIVWLK